MQEYTNDKFDNNINTDKMLYDENLLNNKTFNNNIFEDELLNTSNICNIADEL